MEIFQLSPYEWEALKLSLLVGFWSVLCSLPFGIFFGWLLARREFPGKSILDGVLHLPLVIPPVVTGFVLLMLFGKRGVLGIWLDQLFGFSFAFNWKGAALASAVMSFPLMVQAVRLSIEAVDTGLEQAARTLGASGVKVFFTITLPLALSGVIAGVVLAFARSLGEFGATITFVSNIPGETATLPIALYSLLQMPGSEAAAMKLCAISIILAFAALFCSEYFSKRSKKRRA